MTVTNVLTLIFLAFLITGVWGYLLWYITSKERKKR